MVVRLLFSSSAAAAAAAAAAADADAAADAPGSSQCLVDMLDVFTMAGIQNVCPDWWQLGKHTASGMFVTRRPDHSRQQPIWL
jgi:hypothetical protein